MRPRRRAAQVLEIVESIPAEQWQKLLLCIAFDAAGISPESLPFHGFLELALGPLDYFVLRYLFEDSFAIPVAGLLEEWLPIPVEFLPTATLAWCVQNLAAESEIARKLGLVKKEVVCCKSGMARDGDEGGDWIRLGPQASCLTSASAAAAAGAPSMVLSSASISSSVGSSSGLTRPGARRPPAAAKAAGPRGLLLLLRAPGRPRPAARALSAVDDRPRHARRN